MELKAAVRNAFEAMGRTKNHHCNDVAKYINDNNSEYKELSYETVKARVNAYLLSQSKKKAGEYAKVPIPKKKGSYKKGMYKLKSDKTPSTPPTIEDEDTCNKLFFGKAGEFAVVSELLFREYGASIMSVDDGIDVAASKDGKFFFIQVKSTKQKEDGQASISIRPNKFINGSSSNVFVIIVLRRAARQPIVNKYLILPVNDITKWSATGYISKNAGRLNIKIKTDKDKTYLYNEDKKEELAYYVNRFSLIR